MRYNEDRAYDHFVLGNPVVQRELTAAARGGQRRSLGEIVSAASLPAGLVNIITEDVTHPDEVRYVILVPHDGHNCPEDLMNLAQLDATRVQRIAERERDRGTTEIASLLLQRVPGGVAVVNQVARLWDSNRLFQIGRREVSFLSSEGWGDGELLVGEASVDWSGFRQLGEQYYWPIHRLMVILFAHLHRVRLLLEIHSMDDWRLAPRPAAQVFYRTVAGELVTSRETVDLVRAMLSMSFGEPCLVDSPYVQAAKFANFQIQYNLRCRSGLAKHSPYVCLELAKRIVGEPFPDMEARGSQILSCEESANALALVLERLL